uniref:Uncharacterized protein n=1 Tax=Mycena chlorophos TaxID=658473 RepID=A0ABQ0LQ66_MYCCL|nr:predicted protein [Mycena chlorophos]
MPTSPFPLLLTPSADASSSWTSDLMPTASNFYIVTLVILHLIPNNSIRFSALVVIIFLATLVQLLSPSIDTALARLDARLSEIETLVQTSKASFVGERLRELTDVHEQQLARIRRVYHKIVEDNLVKPKRAWRVPVLGRWRHYRNISRRTTQAARDAETLRVAIESLRQRNLQAEQANRLGLWSPASPADEDAV